MQNFKSVKTFKMYAFHTEPPASQFPFLEANQHFRFLAFSSRDGQCIYKYVLLYTHTCTQMVTYYAHDSKRWAMAFFTKAAEIYPNERFTLEIYHNLFYFAVICFTDGHLGCFQSFSIMNNDVQIPFHIWFCTGEIKKK